MVARICWLTVFLFVVPRLVLAEPDRVDRQQQAATPSAAASRVETAAMDDDPLAAGAIVRLGTTRFRPTRAAQGVSFLPDGRTLVQTTSSGFLEQWEADSGKFLRDHHVTKHYVHKAAHTPDGQRIAMRGSYARDGDKRIGWVALVEAETGRLQMLLEFDPPRGEHMAISADGSTIAVEGEKVSIVDTTAKAEVLNRAFTGQRIWSLGLSPDGQILAIGAESKVLLWNWASGEEPRTVSLGDNPRRRTYLLSVEFSPDGGKLAVGGDHQDGIVLLDVESGKEIRRFNVEGVRFWYPRKLSFSKDGKLLAAPLERNAGGGSGGGAAVWNVESGKLLHRLKAPHESVTHLAFSPDSKLLGGASYWSPQMCVWSLATGERYGGNLPGHAGPPSVLRFLPDDERLVSAGDDATIRVWNLTTADEERVLEHALDSSGRTRWIRAMDVSPNGEYIASSSLDDTVRVWETDTGREIYRLAGHGRYGGRRDVRFTPDSQRLVSWGDDMRVYIWEVGTGKALEEYRAQPIGLALPHESESSDPFGGEPGVFRLEGGALSPDASRLVVLGRDTRVFDVFNGEQIAEFKRAIGIHARPAISPDNAFTLALSQGREPPTPRNAPPGISTTSYSVELRKLADGELVSEVSIGQGGSAAAAFSHDGRQAAICVGHDEPRVLILSVPELNEIARIEGLRGQPQAIAFSRSGKRLAVSNSDTTIVVYDLARLPNRANSSE